MAKKQKTVADEIEDILKIQLGVKDEELFPDTSLQDDLGADSLDCMEMALEIEERFNISIPDKDLEQIKTVGQLMEYVELKSNKYCFHYNYPKEKSYFFKKHYLLSKKWLLRERPSWWEVGLKEFIMIVRKECGYSPKTFWQDIWSPLRTAFLYYQQSGSMKRKGLEKKQEGANKMHKLTGWELEKQEVLSWFEKHCNGVKNARTWENILPFILIHKDFPVPESKDRYCRRIFSELKHEGHLASTSKHDTWFIPLVTTDKAEIEAALESVAEMESRAMDMLRDSSKLKRRFQDELVKLTQGQGSFV